MNTICSPRLHLHYYGMNLLDVNDNFYCCKEGLEDLLEVPKAQYYWLEASTTQWKDRSGISIEIRKEQDWVNQNSWWILYKRKKTTDWGDLSIQMDVQITKWLKTLGFDKSITIYFRLLYQD